MSIKVALDHTTVYSYDKPVTIHPHIIRLRPAPHCRTPILSYSLTIEPAEHFINWQQDPFGNYLARLVFPEKADKMSVKVDLVAELTVINPFDFFVEESAETFPFKYSEVNKDELAPYLVTTKPSPILETWLKKNKPEDETKIIDALVAINQAVNRDVGYQLRMEPGVQTSEETLELAMGSCRDSGWLLVEIMRHYGIAARFVSGYLVQLTPDVKSIDGPSGAEEDFTDLHAWTEVYIPGAGWVGLDPTSGLFAGEGHIPLACTPQPVSAAPISGGTSEAASDFYFHNEVARFDERPRVTLPYSDTEWQRVLDLGKTVDQRLEQQDVRLTMGGEPTFVSIDDMESPEWNNAALGEHKLERAGVFLEKLRTAFSPNGIIAYAQGKWYPGEPTPRWALISHWRTDDKPIWEDPSRLTTPGSHPSTREDASKFMVELCKELGVSDEHVRGLYEDPLHHLHLEALLPEGIELEELELKEDHTRRRLVEQMSEGIDDPIGYMLPLAYSPPFNDEPGQYGEWMTGDWPLRRKTVFLIPGDSPAGLRLPLASLPADTSVDSEANAMLEDNFSPSTPLPDPAAGISFSKSNTTSTGKLKPSIIRTTLCAEVRDGSLYLFLPPMQSARGWVLLMGCIERACVAADVYPVIEGYEPPRDARLQSFRITPDPGVIEVNIHPSRTFNELVERTETIYEAARESRLGAEKFMVDGRHTGTGGGNHVTMGGHTPADSPFLRRPDLLRSLITFWQHHPSLSYLFSGMFIGPTSQAPRIDEARSESLYELEMALSRLPDGDSDKPWLVDRLLRNLLIDLTGNTHRTEICIDKLYSPDGPAGRLGIVELRAFEMPPHARMSIVQALLIRCLISRFWDKPYQGKLIRWGTELHDRFMLPHYLWQDICDVIEDLNRNGLEFDAEWLDAFWEFRFPVYGVRQIDDISIELRAAIEPWHVLGEEASAGGMARYVDSSLERLQVKVSGLNDERYKITCNGYALPMRKTGTAGEYVVGVRYRAWQPTFALHPDLPVDTPLVFDVIDTWSNRSLGGCSYHVADPGGRSYDDVPVNANVAEARRLARFDQDHTPAPAVLKTPKPGSGTRVLPTEAAPEAIIKNVFSENHEYPCTADMRQQRH